MRYINVILITVLLGFFLTMGCDTVTDSSIENQMLSEHEITATANVTISGYGIVKSSQQEFSDSGYAGWSTPSGTVVASGGFQFTQLLSSASTSAPAKPESEWPHHTFGPEEYGWVVQKNSDGSGSSGFVYNVHIDELAGYEIVYSPELTFSDGGWAGWSCPEGKVVLGGGFDADGSVKASAPAKPDSEWPHYTFGADEYGWVVQSAEPINGSVYAICADEPDGYEIFESNPITFSTTGWGGWSVPEGGLILGGGFVSESPVMTSAPAGPDSEWPHYTFGPEEYGWVVQSAGGGLTTINAIGVVAEVDQEQPEDRRPAFVRDCDDYETLGYRNRGQCVRDNNPGR